MLETDELMTYRLVCGQTVYILKWLKTLADDNQITEMLLTNIQSFQPSTLVQLKACIPIPSIQFVPYSEMDKYLLQGYVSVSLDIEDRPEICIIPMRKQQYRSIEEPKEEFTELGPNEAFSESLAVNLYLLRRRLPIDRVKVRNLQFDNKRLEGALVYLDDAEHNAVELDNQLKKAFKRDSSNIMDLSTLALSQNGMQFTLNNVYLLTEHPIQCVRSLLKGRVVLLLEGSCKGLIAPTHLSDYFKAPSDYSLALPFVLLIRSIRIISFIMALTLLPLYVAIVNYHYQMIPSKVIESLYISRYAVPFPAFFEAIIMEVALLVLLEAVARLPTKLSQSAGVVAGIVLGTAVVEAKLISNIMIVIMGASALFTLTSANISLRNLIFVYSLPSLLLANFLGINGIFLFWFLFLARLLQVKSLDQAFATFGIPQLADFLKRRN